jgi:hypothetical protein
MANMNLVQTVVTLSAGVATKIINRNDLRLYLSLQNVGAADLQFGFDNTLTSGNGTTLSPGSGGNKQGGFFIWNDQNIPSNAIYAISAVGTTIAVLEG